MHPNTATLLYFWAPWCAPCKALSPVIAALAEEYAGLVEFEKANADHPDDEPQFEKYGVKSVPTLLVVRSTKDMRAVITQIAPPYTKDRIKKALESP